MEAKTNCKNCLNGDHENCLRPDSCLCADSHNKPPEKKLGRNAPGNYTSSWRRDYIVNYIKNHRELLDIVYSFRVYPNGTFLFDPSQDPILSDLFLDEPKAFESAVKHAVLWIMEESETDDMKTILYRFRNFKVRFTDASKQIKMADWNSDYENIPISTECLVVEMKKLKTYTKHADAFCRGCKKRVNLEVNLYTHQLSKPPKCYDEKCELYKVEMQIDKETFKSGDMRTITIQEPMEEAKHGSPIIYQAEIFDDDVKNTYIGQRKRIVGTFTSYITGEEANDILIKTISLNDVNDDSRLKITDSDITTFKEWLKNKNFLYSLLSRSLAPEIYNEPLAKMALAICTAGGTRIDRLRGDINGFLVGNPSTGKSKIIDYVLKIYPKSSVVNAATASGAGITIAYDDKIKGPRVGPVPLCSGGIVGIDEMGHLRREDTKYLLQSMEDGKIKYDKGGYDFMVPAETTIFGGANPKYDYYDFGHSIVENINLPGPIISRFDIKVNMIPAQSNTNIDAKLQHIDEFRDLGEKKFIEKHDLISSNMLMKYFTYVKKLEPKMTDAASSARRLWYNEILTIQQKTGSMPIDTRFYESLYRMATAIAKLFLSDTVTEEHMNIATKFQKEALETFGMNVSKGETQFNLQQEATSKEGAFKHAVQEVQGKQQDEYVDDEDIVKEMRQRYGNFFPNEDEAWNYFQKMDDLKIILKKKGKYYLGMT